MAAMPRLRVKNAWFIAAVMIVAEAVLLRCSSSRRQQIELHALRRAGQRQAVDSQNDNQRQQRQHHDLGDALQTVLQTEAADEEAREHDNFRPERHLAGLRQHGAEYATDCFGGSCPAWNVPVRNLPK